MDAHCLAIASPGHAVVCRPGAAEERWKIPAVTAATETLPRAGREASDLEPSEGRRIF